jgi:hypothetical protein
LRVLVYVEGKSDADVLTALLGFETGVGLRFLHTNGKEKLLSQAPRRAARHLARNGEDHVFVLPDLYPTTRDGPFAHQTADELSKVLTTAFRAEATKEGPGDALSARFHPHCLIHDLEVLLLGAADRLKRRLRTDHKIERNWRQPIEDQDDQKPPKKVVRELFSKYRGRRYREIADGVAILSGAEPAEIARACPRGFGKFYSELSELLSAR